MRLRALLLLYVHILDHEASLALIDDHAHDLRNSVPVEPGSDVRIVLADGTLILPNAATAESALLVLDEEGIHGLERLALTFSHLHVIAGKNNDVMDGLLA